MESTDSGYYFNPHVSWVKQGGTVTFTNASGSHSATAYAKANDAPQRIPEDAEAFDSGLLSEQGATFEHTFETPGVYDVFCTPHESTGMLCSVVVGEPDQEGQPGLAGPQSSLSAAAAEKVRSLNESCMKLLGDQHGDTSTDDGHHD